MTLVEIKDAFFQCGFPFYKHLSIHGCQATCTLYSIHSSRRKDIVLNLTNKADLLHQIALEVIKLYCHDLQTQEDQYVDRISTV